MSKFELNQGDQVIVAIDVSGSMKSDDTPNGQNRFEYATDFTRNIIRSAAKYDTDGVSVYFFNNGVKTFKNVTLDNIETDVLPSGVLGGGTDHALVINTAYAEHKSSESGQTFLVVITDGEPSGSKEAVAKAIVDITKDVKDPAEFRISLLQVGNDGSATAFLQWLDDGLTAAGAVHDIVDTKRLDEVTFEDAIEGALND